MRVLFRSVRFRCDGHLRRGPGSFVGSNLRDGCHHVDLRRWQVRRGSLFYAQPQGEKWSSIYYHLYFKITHLP